MKKVDEFLNTFDESSQIIDELIFFFKITMLFDITKKLNRTAPQPVSRIHNVLIYGFESAIVDLRIYFADAKGVITYYEIPDTSVGFAQDQLEDAREVWFEYAYSDRDLTIELITE